MTIINDILEISKIEGRKDQSRTDQMSPSPSVLGDVMAMMHIRAGEKGIYLTSDFTGLIARNDSYRPQSAASNTHQPDRKRDKVHRQGRRASQRQVSRR